jgi:hypothetical protein
LQSERSQPDGQHEGLQINRHKAEELIRHLNSQLIQLDAKKRESDSHFAAAWAIYGSELAGDPIGKKIEKEKREIDSKLETLQKFIDGKIPDDFESRLDEFHKKITELHDEVADMERLRYILEL